MALKTFKPITSAQRGLVLVDNSSLYKGKPLKKLTKGLNKSGGRNNYGNLRISPNARSSKATPSHVLLTAGTDDRKWRPAC